MYLFFPVLTVLFSVFGFLCALHMLCEWLFASEQITAAIEIKEKKDAEMLDMLLHEAGSASLRKGRGRLVVLLSADLMDGTVGLGETLSPFYQDLIDRYGAECYLIDP